MESLNQEKYLKDELLQLQITSLIQKHKKKAKKKEIHYVHSEKIKRYYIAESIKLTYFSLREKIEDSCLNVIITVSSRSLKVSFEILE